MQEVGARLWGHPWDEQRVGTHWHWVALISIMKNHREKNFPGKIQGNTAQVWAKSSQRHQPELQQAPAGVCKGASLWKRWL